MTISYENTAEDAYAWNYYHLTQTPKGRRLLRNNRFLQSFYGTLMVLAAANLYTVLQGAFVTSVVFYLIAIPQVFLVSYGLLTACFEDDLKRNIRNHLKKTQTHAFLGRKEADLLPEGLRIAWDGGYAVQNWSTLQDFSQTETHFVFFFGDANFILIPKRAFDAAHQQEFWMTVERLRAGAGAVTAGTGGISLPASSTGAPWWRNRNAVDTTEEKSPLQQRRL
ncbi:MAG: YcxB family protein [Armatimonadota bacterium]